MIKNLLRSYRRSRFLVIVNILGLAAGLSVFAMLFLIVTNELSYDRNFKDADRIILLNTVTEEGGHKEVLSITPRLVLTKVPEAVPGIEAATQTFNRGYEEVKYDQEQFHVNTVATETSFFEVFSMKFIEGDKSALKAPNTVVINDRVADIIFGGAEQAMGKVMEIRERDYTVTGVVQRFPKNTHFRYEAFIEIGDDKNYGGMEYHTYYKIDAMSSVEQTSKIIEQVYTEGAKALTQGSEIEVSGVVDKFTDIYLKTQSDYTYSSMNYLWTLIAMAVVILIMGVTNFINLFVSQGETRMMEIGIRKTNGAQKKNMIKQFVSEIGMMVLIAVLLAIVMSIVAFPYVEKLVGRSVDPSSLYSVEFIALMVVVIIITLLLSATYPTLYLSKFNPLDILERRVRFSKRRLTATVVITQSVISIVLIALIVSISLQLNHLKSVPLQYEPDNIFCFSQNSKTAINYDLLKQEIAKIPGVVAVSGGDHIFGGGISGQGIELKGEGVMRSIDEYRVDVGVCEMVGLTVIEGELYKPQDASNDTTLVINEAAVRMLGLNYPVVGTEVTYDKPRTIRAVVKDFVYYQISEPVQPIAIRGGTWGYFNNIYVKIDGKQEKTKIVAEVESVVRKVDDQYLLYPIWLDDVYELKFTNLNTQAELLIVVSLLALLISMLGLLAIHLFTATRRKREIAIRRVNGATGKEIFSLLSFDVLKWIVLAGVIAVPIAYYIIVQWLNDYSSRINISVWIFLIPVLIQMLIAMVTISGVSLGVLRNNPVETLKEE